MGTLPAIAVFVSAPVATRSSPPVASIVLPATSVRVAPERSTRPDPAVTMAGTVADVFVITLDNVELSLLVVSPIVRVSPAPILIALLLPTLLSAVKV